ncbi:hypothetical protein [Pseudomonas fluorescens]|uniref:hypothetical protein n=1 Tax=Pseudomonas fluorescens TaxID=294 RepID=UPI000AC08831|nr:hypothetical protein [Pseudomonas fluorescens]
MSHYFDHASQELYSKIAQAKVYITRHNPTTGALAEAVLRQFLKDHLPGAVSVSRASSSTARAVYPSSATF